MTTRGRSVAGALALAAVAVTGCGTTVHVTSSTAAGVGNDGLTTTGGTQAATSATAGAAGAAAGGSASGAAGNSGAASAGSAGTSVGSGAASGATGWNGPGVTATTITLGFSYWESAQAANDALGARNIGETDPHAVTDVLINDINAHGGIAGRKIVPLFWSSDPQSTTPYATQAQSMCTYFTQDHHVFGLFNGVQGVGLDARHCLEQHGVAFFGGDVISGDLSRHEIDVASARLDRAFSAMVAALTDQRWFAPWNKVTGAPGTSRAKVGILTVDDPSISKVVDGVLLPLLRRAGYEPAATDVIRIGNPQSETDDGAAVAAIHNAVLKFNTDGVDHVILTDANGSLTLFFANDAYSQHYYPRYGGTSGNGWQALLAAGDIQARSLVGAVGAGWLPTLDLPYQSGDGPWSNPARHRCLQLMAKHGQRATDNNTLAQLAGACDELYLLPTALRGYRGPLNWTTLFDRVDALGSSYQLASGLGSRFAPDQSDGIAKYADMVYDTSCTCIAYRGQAKAIPSVAA